MEIPNSGKKNRIVKLHIVSMQQCAQTKHGNATIKKRAM